MSLTFLSACCTYYEQPPLKEFSYDFHRRVFQFLQYGGNENTNGLLRGFFVNGISLNHVDSAQAQRVFLELNLRPRKRLGRESPHEVYYNITLHLL